MCKCDAERSCVLCLTEAYILHGIYHEYRAGELFKTGKEERPCINSGHMNLIEAGNLSQHHVAEVKQRSF
jgi:hypothetical protein